MSNEFLEKVKQLFGSSSPAPPQVTRRRIVSTSVPLPGQSGIKRVRHLEVQRDTHPVWYTKGWRQDSKTPGRFFGEFRKGRNFYQGEIVKDWNGFQPYIERPLTALKGPHAVCFTAVREGYYRVHLPTPAQSVEEAIHAVELVL